MSRRGRPSREYLPSERVPMSFRVRPEMKNMMDNAAGANGRSVSQEVEMRLENSFHEDRVLAALASKHGCICPPTSEQTCQGAFCPRRPSFGARL